MEHWLGNRGKAGRGETEIVSIEISCAILGINLWIESSENVARN